MDKLGTSFHRKFALNRPGVTQVLRVVESLDRNSGGDAAITFRRLEEQTTLGPVYIAAMRRYAYGMRLLDEGERLTAFGRAVVRKDAELNQMATLWCLHVNLSLRNGPGPLFWHYLVVNALRPGEMLDSRGVGALVYDLATREGIEGVGRQTAEHAAPSFLGTYCKADALGPLRILEEAGGGKYKVMTPTPPPLWAFGYALADYWASNWGDVTGVNLTRLAEEGGLGAIFMMGGGLINRYLGELQREGFVVVQRRTPPFQLTRNWQNPEVFLERMYGEPTQIG